jgi:hypothetical protein
MTQEQLLTGDDIQKEINHMKRAIGKLMALDFFSTRNTCGSSIPYYGEDVLDSIEADVKKQMVDRINTHIANLEKRFKAL